MFNMRFRSNHACVGWLIVVNVEIIDRYFKGTFISNSNCTEEVPMDRPSLGHNLKSRYLPSTKIITI
jgi:hypothetical protein